MACPGVVMTTDTKKKKLKLKVKVLKKKTATQVCEAEPDCDRAGNPAVAFY